MPSFCRSLLSKRYVHKENQLWKLSGYQAVMLLVTTNVWSMLRRTFSSLSWWTMTATCYAMTVSNCGDLQKSKVACFVCWFSCRLWSVKLCDRHLQFNEKERTVSNLFSTYCRLGVRKTRNPMLFTRIIPRKRWRKIDIYHYGIYVTAEICLW